MSKIHGGRQPYTSPQRRLTVRAEELMARAPLRDAALQMLPGDDGASKYPASRWFFDTCPALKRMKPNEPNYTGLRHGRVVVVGLLDKQGHFTGKWNASSWVVRCDCGLFETRRTRVAREGKKDGTEDMCHRCLHHKNLGSYKPKSIVAPRSSPAHRQQYFNRHGRWPEDDGWDTSKDDWVRVQ